MKNEKKKFISKITDSCANKLINIGEKHCESTSIIFTFYEPKLSKKLLNEINK
ncbi:hypothetical protein CM240_3255 [Clostridium bornimense]|uniref:Cyclic lactone autoinducer peptide n=1 Tax=Clostridium bornimense TaxID=1216932 RepID=W6S7I6_9CLOT|nr:hypothetical protein [Clostridium bornimense]CDM70372.1 hypothetical protein CM240_3255 [Clostridium bornimense]